MQNESINDSLSDLKQMFQHTNKQNSEWEEQKVFHCNIWIPLSRAASISFVKCASFPTKCRGDEFQLNKSTCKHICCIDTQTKQTVYTEISLLCMHQSLVWSLQTCRALLIKILMKSHPYLSNANQLPAVYLEVVSHCQTYLPGLDKRFGCTNYYSGIGENKTSLACLHFFKPITIGGLNPVCNKGAPAK